ncbi:hypothetical protein FGE12_12230 [Aggregicoccus sp. 17bor-14]|uniref:hypothetical protein n=1 Tax=Myxococcaceae TaxID=31 RepID=UPI00129C8019|nr:MULTISPECIES: hypothetical protein [Myxococcaceae]MBF5043157.1 hypothetical protein [Simulacricoccus sp. 17bor-14]MRI88916.1 hypothetical protein [Aggregicoccus sp. 17bor-14]
MPLRNALLVILAFGLGFAGGCAAGDLPAGLSESEAQHLGITEGVAGRAALRTGNCAPGCLSDCDISPPGVSLRAVPVSDGFSPAETYTCQLSIVTGGEYLSFPEASLGTAHADSVQLNHDTYALALAPGRYALVLVDEQGCAQCVQRAGAGACAVTEVLPGRVSVADVLLDEGAE